MKRDWDLIRVILQRAEEKPSMSGAVAPAQLAEYPAELVSYQIRLLIDAGLVEGACNHGGPLFCQARALTWAGHEFLDQTRSQTTWMRIRTVLVEKGIDLSFDAIKAAASILLKDLSA